MVVVSIFKGFNGVTNQMMNVENKKTSKKKENQTQPKTGTQQQPKKTFKKTDEVWLAKQHT